MIDAPRLGHAVSEHTATMWDGTELFYRAWIPPAAANKALLLFHRGHEHSGRWQETVETLDLDDVAVFAWDAPGERGSAPSLAAVIKDIDCFVRHVAQKHQIAVEDMIVMAHGIDAVAVAAWVHDYAPPLRALVLATPAFRGPNALPDLHDTSTRLLADAGAITVPSLMLCAGDDRVVERSAQENSSTSFLRLSSGWRSFRRLARGSSFRSASSGHRSGPR